ncbi:MAG TPA: Fe-S cluster domain-containing protein [Candidatus Scatomorpha merdavium]|nr:Fe-S cluster domain-containing protein [Candidatus Scatomorpha merdavium]
MDGIMNIVYAILVLGVMGAVFGGLLAFAAKIFHVEQDPRIEEVRAALAGANCGGCGFAGCDAYAAAVVAGEAPPNKCSPGGAATAEKVAAIMGLDAEPEAKYVAFVPCSGGTGVAKEFFDYEGPKDCAAAMRFGNKGPKQCQFSCIGLGNCVRACQFGAMHIENGVAVVDREKCVACMACYDACPKKIIRKVPYEQRVLVGCRSEDKGAQTRKMCDAGCIGCMKCQKECPHEAIKVVNFVATIDYDKCTGCGHCAEVCPRHIIHPQKIFEQ